MSGISYLLGLVGQEVQEINPDDPESSNIFTYEKKCYKIVIDLSHGGKTEYSIKTFLSDIKKVPQYSLKTVESSPIGAPSNLGVYFTPLTENSGSIASKIRLFNQFFRTKDQQMQEDLLVKSSDSVSFSTLYEKLREAHSGEIIHTGGLEDVQHEGLRPQLRPYQKDAVRWLLHRELYTEYLPTDFIEITANNLRDERFFYNPRTMEIVANVPEDIAIPSGGILADEMGLGKTVEMLALILNNPRGDVEKAEVVDDDDLPLASVALHRHVQCLCGGRYGKKKQKLIKCLRCTKSQHRGCVIRREEDTPGRYICPECWKNEPPVESKATFIVSPASIKKQWESEIVRHVRSPNFRVLVYDGVCNSGWIDPTAMAEYDVVITDYNVMRSEIYFTSENSRSGKAHESHFTPSLHPMVRVCLDEAQLVETTTAQCAKMVKTLPTIHRWAVTGTPIEKHINNLHGLVFFLDVYPYTNTHEWGKLVIPFASGNCEPLIGLLRKIMWRTCKSLVFQQIGIPPQKEVVHYVTMSDLQTFFYRSQHSLCRNAFIEKAQKIRTTLAMSKMSPHILKLLLKPLRKLRLDCTVPSVVRAHRSDQAVVKKTLAPNELHAHLVGNNEIEAKAQLRTIVSSFNALAGIAMIKDDPSEAEKMYKAVLRRAKDYTGAISVDSLLQIHALHNLIEIIDFKKVEVDKTDGNTNENVKDEETRAAYEEELKRLEGKYINSYHTKMKQVEKQLRDATDSLERIEAAMTSTDGNWWREIFSTIRGTNREDALLDKIYLDIHTQYGSMEAEDLRIFEHRYEVVKAFKKLAFFTENVDPAKHVDAAIREKIEGLIYEAFECHLDVEQNQEEPEAPKPKKKRTVLCQLCRVKQKIRNFECVIFDKKYLENINSLRGSWNPSMEEVIAKTILAHSKKDHTPREIVEEAEQHLEYIEVIKKEYKEYSQLWSEIDYTVSAFDELKMCKSRLEAIRPEDLEKGEKKSKTQIFTYEIADAEEEFRQQLQMAEKEFIRVWGVLKYLKHLEKNTGPEVCPICTQKPEEKCGHHLCMICMVQLRKYQKHNLTCSVCRHRQKYKE
uniref:Putative dna repair protein rad16 n=1 Tax=Lutzomyia longipalpis TaxID=7200 RepID=A0A1B0GI16_LUTLO